LTLLLSEAVVRTTVALAEDNLALSDAISALIVSLVPKGKKYLTSF
jgi:hypothetical protein